ncbi:hypothetical protein [Fervidibacillus albus]|uniref:Uncharacterized protein n=1 Tax=Fervidibacillus albus TaxID=2980026 RepID=A0A9E8LW59_9BACI|nr:hypothetical protein [Fervidibacillus albus]WAA10684.1 hypothetical protein OE104_05045 [Fervidibacillus albus]
MSFTENLEKNFLPRNDLSIIITDGWESIDQFAILFKRVSPRSKEIRFLHVLGKEEIDPPYRNDIKLIDSEKETGNQVTMSKRMIDLYKGKLHEHMKRLSVLCRRYKIAYLQVHTGEDVRKFFLQTCKKHGWLE